MAKLGKPIKFDETKRAAYLANLENGMGRTQAIASVGIARSTLAEHRNTNADFARLESEAEMKAVGTIENALFESAKGGNVTAQQVFLYNRASDRWKDQRNLHHSGKVSMTREEAETEIRQSHKLLDRFKLLPETGTDGNGRKGNGRKGNGAPAH
jgi:hypothetical protein